MRKPGLNGVERIAAERERQIKKLRWSKSHDDAHDKSELAWAAICYAAPDRIYAKEEYAAAVHFVDPWPWHERYDHRPYDGNVLTDPSRTQYIRQLEKAGALIAAEIDRLLRKKK